MDKLKEIIKHKREHLKQQMSIKSIEQYKDTTYYNRETISLKQRLSIVDDPGIIAEFKRQSPSKGKINLSNSQLINVTKNYQNAGAAAISVLTDKKYFGGSNEDILSIRDQIDIPILRKEFIIDAYQIHEAKAIGADVILLIAAVLTKKDSQTLCNIAKSLNLEVLFEVHDKSEIKKIPNNVDVVGVNNRDLKVFKVDFSFSKKIINHLPNDVLKISESGISNIDTINDLSAIGYNGFLIGETFMKTEEPGKTCKQFIANCKKQSL